MCAPWFSAFVNEKADIIAPTREDYVRAHKTGRERHTTTGRCSCGGLFCADISRLRYTCDTCGQTMAARTTFHQPQSKLGYGNPTQGLCQTPLSHTSVAAHFGLKQDNLLPIEYSWWERKTSIDYPPMRIDQIRAGWIRDLAQRENLNPINSPDSPFLKHSNSLVAQQIRDFERKRVPDAETLLGLMEFWWPAPSVPLRAVEMLPREQRPEPKPTGKVIMREETAAYRVDQRVWDAMGTEDPLPVRAWRLFSQDTTDPALRAAVRKSVDLGRPVTTHRPSSYPSLEMLEQWVLVGIPIEIEEEEKAVLFPDYADAFRANVPKIWKN